MRNAVQGVSGVWCVRARRPSALRRSCSTGHGSTAWGGSSGKGGSINGRTSAAKGGTGATSRGIVKSSSHHGHTAGGASALRRARSCVDVPGEQDVMARLVRADADAGAGAGACAVRLCARTC